MAAAKKAAIYLRISVGEQTSEDQRRDLETAATQRGWVIIATYADEGISGAKGRDKRPGFDTMLRDARQSRFDVVMCWAVDRIGRSLPDLVGTLQELHRAKVDLFLHQQAFDTTTAAGRAMFGMMNVLAEFQRSISQARIKAGLIRARTNPRTGAKAFGRPKVADIIEEEIRSLLRAGTGIMRAARMVGVGTGTVQRIKAELRPKWTINSLRPPTPGDGPFHFRDLSMGVAADVVSHLLPKTTTHFDNTARKYTALPLQAELDRLCRAFNHEVLAALAGALRHRAREAVKRGRREQLTSIHPASQNASHTRLRADSTKHFDASVRKNPTLPLRDELEHLCRTLPPKALSALGDALRETVAGHVKKGVTKLEGLGGPPARIRAAVQTRRNRGLSDAQIAREIEHLLPPGQSTPSRRKRAQREVAGIPRPTGAGPTLSFEGTYEQWAIVRAARQLEAVLKRGLLTKEEAEQRLEARKLRFMSRASGQRPR